MTLEIAFWVLMLVWLVFGVVTTWPRAGGGNVMVFGGTLLHWVLLFLLGWRVFGPILKG